MNKFNVLWFFGALFLTGCSDVELPDVTEIVVRETEKQTLISEPERLAAVSNYVQGLPGQWYRSAVTMPSSDITVELKKNGGVVGRLYVGKTWLAFGSVPPSRGLLSFNPPMKNITPEQRARLLTLLSP